MKLKVKNIPLRLEHSSAMVSPDDAAELGLIVGDRVKISYGKKFCVSDVHIATGMVDKGEIGICMTAGPCEIEIPEGAEVEVYPVSKPKSIEYIKKKMDGKKLNRDEIHAIVRDIVSNMLTEVELTAFVMADYLQHVDIDEIEWLTEAMIDTGETLTFEKGIVVDKHSIGGVPGNKISLLVVPIIAASGLMIPKTASRAITSASGTADTMEVLADVNLGIDEIREVTESVGGVIAWAGATNIAPADDKIISVEHPLSIDPRPQLLASVMAKKGSIGAKHIVIDIPVGEGSKVADVEQGRTLSTDFSELGRRMGLDVSCVMTYGGQPVGRTIGPALEAREALKVLETAKGPRSLIEKATGVAGVLLEMSGKTRNGSEYANQLIESGKALEKFKQIVEGQGGDPEVTSKSISVGTHKYDMKAPIDGAVAVVNNSKLVKVARAAGAPKDKGAGIVLHKKGGQHVKAGASLFTIYAEKEWKLDQAIELATPDPPLTVSSMILERYPSYRVI